MLKTTWPLDGEIIVRFEESKKIESTNSKKL
jgi:hypothetical protein